MDDQPRARRYAVYLRRSSDDATKQVRSIKDQRAACLDVAKQYDIDVKPEDIIEEDRSARRSGNRPKFSQLLADIRSGKIDGIIAWAPDRLARNMKEAGEVIDLLDERFIVDLKFAAHHFFNDYNGVMGLGIAFVLAKQYTDKLAHDVRRGMNKALKEGKSAGQHKPGYLRDERTGYYEPDETMCANGMTMFQLVQEGWQMRVAGETLAKIAKQLNDNGYFREIKRSGAKQRMGREKLRRVFADTFYYGTLVQAGERVDLTSLGIGAYQPMIDEADFLRAQRMTRPELSVPNHHKFPFRGLLLCGSCNNPLVAGAPRGRTGRRYLRYWCGRSMCPSTSIRAKDVITAIVEVADTIQAKPEHYTAYKKAAKNALKTTRFPVDQRTSYSNEASATR